MMYRLSVTIDISKTRRRADVQEDNLETPQSLSVAYMREGAADEIIQTPYLMGTKFTSFALMVNEL